MKVLRVKDWAKHFENNRTRELKRMEWVPVPNKHDGDGFTELVDHPAGMAYFGVWNFILQVASKCDVRDTLSRDAATPHDAASLARIARSSKQLFEDVIDRLLYIKWLEVYDTETDTSINVAPSCGETAPRCGTVPMEGNGMERKRREEEAASSSSPAFQQITPEYITELKKMPAYKHLDVAREAEIAAKKSELKYPGKPMTKTFLLSWLGNLPGPDPQAAAKQKAAARQDDKLAKDLERSKVLCELAKNFPASTAEIKKLDNMERHFVITMLTVEQRNELGRAA